MPRKNPSAIIERSGIIEDKIVNQNGGMPGHIRFESFWRSGHPIWAAARIIIKRREQQQKRRHWRRKVRNVDPSKPGVELCERHTQGRLYEPQKVLARYG